MPPPSPPDAAAWEAAFAQGEDRLVALLNSHTTGWVHAMGMTYVRATPDLVVLRWTVDERHLQPAGIVHGGVHAGVVETTCSIGAAIAAATRGHRGQVVGLDNHTTFIRTATAGAHLEAQAHPLTRGRTTHVWETDIRSDQGDLIATGRLRLLLTPPPSRG